MSRLTHVNPQVCILLHYYNMTHVSTHSRESPGLYSFTLLQYDMSRLTRVNPQPLLKVLTTAIAITIFFILILIVVVVVVTMVCKLLVMKPNKKGNERRNEM